LPISDDVTQGVGRKKEEMAGGQSVSSTLVVCRLIWGRVLVGPLSADDAQHLNRG